MFKKIGKTIRQMFQKIQYKDIEQSGKEISYVAYDLAEWVIGAGVAILLSTFLGLIVFNIMAVGGLSAVLADLMASTCTPGVPCDFNTRLGGVGLTLVVLTAFFIMTMRMTVTENVMLTVDMQNEDEPCRNYNHKQVELLRIIQAMNGTKNLRKFSTYMETAYTTTRNYMDLFERDGYIKIHSNGQGSQVEIEVMKK